MVSPENARRVLIVDDSPLTLDVLDAKLSSHGYDVTTVESGEEAVALATGPGEPYELLIVDVKMPGISGYEVTKRVRADAKTAHVPVLLLTSLDASRDKVDGLEAGADEFMNKAVSDGELFARVRSLIAIGELRERLFGKREVLSRFMETDPTVTPLPEEDRSGEVRLVCAHTDASVAARLGELGDDEHRYVLEALDPTWATQTTLKRYRADIVVVDEKVFAALEGFELPHGLIVLDSETSAERRIAAFDAGVEDYLPASTPLEELRARIGSVLRRRHRFRSVEKLRDRAVRAAIRDQATGLFNRYYFRQALDAEVQRTERYGAPFSLLMLDVDDFKIVNDTYGHPTGDEVLQEIASRMKAVTRASDVVSRIGGEEFAVILPQTSRPEGLLAGEKLRAAVATTPFATRKGGELRVTASLGVAVCPVDALDAQTLIDMADAALYVSKRAGKNRVTSSETPLKPDNDPQPPEMSERVASVVMSTAMRLAWLLSHNHESPLQAHREAMAAALQSQEEPARMSEAVRMLMESGADLEMALQKLLGPIEDVVGEIRLPKERKTPAEPRVVDGQVGVRPARRAGKAEHNEG